jgi:hypothetical protein
MVTRQMASQAATLSATEGEPRVSSVPSFVRDALADPHWCRAMEEEYVALIANQTWDLVPRIVFKAARRAVARHSFKSPRRRLGEHKAWQGDAI